MGKVDAERNLLLGFLALQLDFVSREQFLGALSLWVTDKNRNLGDLFRQLGSLSAERLALLEALVCEHLRAHQGDPSLSMAALSSLGSVRKDLEILGDSDVIASLPLVSSQRSMADMDDPYATRYGSIGRSTSSNQRFRILRPHAKGGLGEVFVALDGELNREVAIKEIQDKYVDHPISRSRFILEAEVTGGLEHPGIVPVYGMGHY